MGSVKPITASYLTLIIKSRNFAKRQCKLQWLTPSHMEKHGNGSDKIKKPIYDHAAAVCRGTLWRNTEMEATISKNQYTTMRRRCAGVHYGETVKWKRQYQKTNIRPCGGGVRRYREVQAELRGELPDALAARGAFEAELEAQTTAGGGP